MDCAEVCRRNGSRASKLIPCGVAIIGCPETCGFGQRLGPEPGHMKSGTCARAGSPPTSLRVAQFQASTRNGLKEGPN